MPFFIQHDHIDDNLVKNLSDSLFESQIFIVSVINYTSGDNTDFIDSHLCI